MAAAEALLEWQPLMHLQHTNYHLREENRYLRFQVQELLEWKERAVRHMVTLAPKRSKAKREIKHAAQLQQQLLVVEKTLQDRAALEESTQRLEENERAFETQIAKLELDKQHLTVKCDALQVREAKLTDTLQSVSDMFRVHLEKLVAMRETLDTTMERPHSEDDNSANAAATLEAMNENDGADHDDLNVPPAAADQDPLKSAEIMIAGLTVVSEKCLHWFHEHVEQTFVQQQQKAALYEAQHAELQHLRAHVDEVQQQHSRRDASNQQQRIQIAQLQHTNAHLESEFMHWQTRYVAHAQGQTHVGDQMRLLVTEIRQYLRLVRVEIKKKFGYVPEAIAHAENWSRILDALDALERHVHIANASAAGGEASRHAVQ
uniref:Uncharacterized protein n=1 Tax=Globisporangium ultimum (strain ATCC 200006 / CBS 805.95 / DAOM BR144) TaxID=431595 RepID=K3WYB4_GLOUD